MKYIVTIPWHGVKKGDEVELEKLHPALKANVMPMPGGEGKLEPATPKATASKSTKK